MDIANSYLTLLHDKISGLKDIERGEFRYSHILLFAEYQSRLFKWKTVLKNESFYLFNKDKSFHNLFLDLSPLWINELIPEEKVICDLNELGFSRVHLTHRDYYGFFVAMYLNWEIFKEYAELKKHDSLPHPYETVYMMFCRGGDIFNGEKKFEVDSRTYIKHDHRFELPPLTTEFLDFVDAETATHSHGMNYPDQEKVFQLWQKFNK